MFNLTKRRLQATTAFSAALIAGFVVGASARAQDAPSPDTEATEVVVTGSRIARRDYTSPSPISTITAEALRSTGDITLQKAISSLPQFGLGENSTQTGFNTSGQATLNLRGLGSYRNLVLLDGRRIQPSNVQQTVDINTIPRALIESVEVITGGASSTYGSDAIAGVVNFRTKKHFEGVALEAQYNVTEHGDGATSDISATFGKAFNQKRGNAVLSVSYSKRDTVDYQSRAFFRENQGGTDLRIPTGAYTPGTNRPSQAALDALFATYGVAAGSVKPTSALSFNADGSLFSASGGVYNYQGSQGGILYSTGNQVNNPNVYLTLQAPLKRVSVFGQTTYELTPNITAFGQVQYSSYSTQIIVESGNTELSIPVTNPFIPDELQTLLASRTTPTANLTLQKRFLEAGPRLTNRDFQVGQFTAGLRGNLEGLDGSWEVYATHGETKIDETQPGSVRISRLKNVINAADGGASLCDGGYDPFGRTTLSASCYSYLVSSPYRHTKLGQDVFEANLQGKAFDLPAGDARFAAGVSYRKNTYKTDVDPILEQADVVGVLFTSDSTGSTNVKEIYGELFLPLLSGLPFAKKLDVNLGYRYSDYNLSGGADTYKADLTWTPVNDLTFRAGYGRAVRAPSVGELFVPNNGAIPGIGEVANGLGDPCDSTSSYRTGSNATQISVLCVTQGISPAAIGTFRNSQNEVNATNSGNRELQPETADTYTYGFVFRPHFDTPWLSRTNLTVDHYDITVEDAIGVISASASLAKCFNADGSNTAYSSDNFFCQNIQRDASGRISNIFQPTLNLGAYKTAGTDIQLDWGINLSAIGLSSSRSIDINTNVTYLDKFDVQTTKGGSYAHYAGTVGGTASFQPGSLPKWKALTSATYRSGGTSIGVRWRYLGEMDSSAKATNPASTTPGQKSYSLYDLYGAFNVNPTVGVRFGVNNLTNKDPERLAGRLGTTEASTYDVLGRTYYLGISAKF